METAADDVNEVEWLEALETSNADRALAEYNSYCLFGDLHCVRNFAGILLVAIVMMDGAAWMDIRMGVSSAMNS